MWSKVHKVIAVLVFSIPTNTKMARIYPLPSLDVVHVHADAVVLLCRKRDTVDDGVAKGTRRPAALVSIEVELKLPNTVGTISR